MSEELKPCPFCGSKNIRIWDNDNILPWVQCNDCLTSIATRETREEAITAWNRRANDETN